MWISEPMPVMTRIITADNGSRRSVKSALKSPEVIQVKTWFTIARASGSSWTRRTTDSSDTAKEPIIALQATAPAAALDTRRPKLALTRNPRNGRSGISSSIERTARRHEGTKTSQFVRCVLRTFVSSWLPFQARKRFRVQRLAVPEQRDDDRQADGRFRGRDGHHEEHDDLAVGRAERAAQRDERQVHRIQHDLDRQQDRDQVAADEHAGGADGKEDGRQDQVVVQRDHGRFSVGAGPPAPKLDATRASSSSSSGIASGEMRGSNGSRRASTTAPTIATRIRIEVTSKAKA